MRRKFIYGIKVIADGQNLYIIKEALDLMKEKTPEFFWLIVDNVKEMRQLEDRDLLWEGPARTIKGKSKIEFTHILARQFKTYTVAFILVHEATHIVDQRKGLPYTKESEIRANEAGITFLRALGQALGKVEDYDLEERIKSIEKGNDMIRKGLFYSELP